MAPRRAQPEDFALVNGHCEDYPCCGHELGDCAGLKYGSDEDIKASAERAMHDFDEYGYIAEDDH